MRSDSVINKVPSRSFSRFILVVSWRVKIKTAGKALVLMMKFLVKHWPNKKRHTMRYQRILVILIVKFSLISSEEASVSSQVNEVNSDGSLKFR